VLVRLGWVRAQGGDQRAAVQLFDQALAESRDDPGLAAGAEKGLVWMTHMLGDLEAADAHARAALAHAKRSDDPDLPADALADLGFVEVLRGNGGGLLLLRRAVEHGEGREVRWRQILSRSSWLLALALEYGDKLEEAKMELDALQQGLIDSGDESALAFVESHLCRIAVLTGDWPRAAVHAEVCYDLSLQCGDETEVAFALSSLALVAAHMGDAVATRARADEGLRLAERAGLLPVRIELLASLGLVKLSLGDFAAAEAALSVAAAEARSGGFVSRRKVVVSVLAALLGLAAAAPSFADPSFGPGQSGSNGNQSCKPPGQTKDLPQCR
jgi:tetratricopeptide (TPR) repeat protein